MNDLAIIIPAYKAKYFDEALESLANQTSKSFTVYIGDDATKENIKEISDKFSDRLNLIYYRFDENLGMRDLVAHWSRCVALTRGEKWIWLFSDDDIAEPECVEAFYKEIQLTDSYYDAYRFNTVKIGKRGELLWVSPESPVVEDSYSLAYHILRDERGNSMPDHIFKRSKYDSCGGFVNFSFAQSADWATSILFSKPKGLRTIKGPKVRWRYSGDNISSQASRLRSRSIFGYLQFAAWIKREFVSNEMCLAENQDKKISLDLLERQLFRMFKYQYRGIPWSIIFRVSGNLSKIFDWSILRSLKYCIKVNYIVWRISIRSGV